MKFTSLVFSKIIFVSIALVIIGVLGLVLFYTIPRKSADSAAFKVIETNDGSVRGLRKTTFLKKVDFYSFKGIPFAKPPIGDLRFKAPEPVEAWAPTVIDAFEHGSTCMRTSKMAPDNTTKSEDCLFLNIYVPADMQPDTTLAVMFNVHGGAYSLSTGNDFWHNPEFLLEQRVIVVTSNYRLGVFGFLNFGTPEYSGNMAMKDQQLALKWIHENIKHFSGDNRRITIFGESSGSCSAHLHTLSSESRKYFRNAIAMTGTAENRWALSDKDTLLNMGYKIAEDLKAPQKNSEGLIELFKSIPAEKIVDFAFDELGKFFNRYSVLTLAPIVESKDAIRPFITDYPEEIYKKEKIENDIIFGYYSLEEAVFYDKSIPGVFDIESLEKNFTLEMPFRDVNFALDSPVYKKIAAEVREFYFKNETIDENVVIPYLELLSDINFSYAVNKAARDHAMKTAAKSYYYRFSAKTALNFYTMNNAAASIPMAGHADGFFYVFFCGVAAKIYDKILNTPEDKESKIMSRIIEDMTKMFTDFAKFGTPNPNNINGFLPIENEKENFLDITNDGLVVGVNPNHAAFELWRRIEQQIRENT